MRHWQRQHLIWVLVAASCVEACGTKGQGGDDSGGGGASGSAPNLAATNVSGTFALGSTDRPAAGFDLWMFDHTQITLTESPLDDAGAFRLPLSQFTTGHTYSLHLLKDFAWIGDVNLAPSTPGMHPAFVYQGGVGFDLGQVVIPLDSRGLPAALQSGVTASVGGGFNLAPGKAAAFGSFPLPAHVSSAAVSSQLYVFDAQALLYSFYGRAQHALAYARDLRRYSRVGAVVLASDEPVVTEVNLGGAGSWLRAARLPSGDDSVPESASLWGTTGNSLTKTADARYEFSVFSGGPRTTEDVVVLKVRPNAGPDWQIPRLLGRSLSMPPQLTAVSGSGGTAVAVDYTTASASNGLTNFFCQTGEVVLDLTPPLDGSGTAIAAAVFDRIEVEVDLYGATDQKTSKLVGDASQFASPYNAAYGDSTLPGLARTWDPVRRRLTFTVGASAGASTVQELRLWSGLFPTTYGGQKVSAARLRIYYKSDAEATAAATAVWFKVGC